ncbi:MAG: metal-sensitive transcriptional regulator [Actinomycetaceae bacterium]|nr:metal-sensitive transcriptional regulator [Actinomycetaceae bacterium]MDY5854377.1 metal-sensitive transcriptional regulator [Arcanobacterium sp.]
MKLDPKSTKNAATRLKRARGQLEAVIRMLDEGADCEQVVTQLSAVSKAIDRAGYTLIATGMQQCMGATGAEKTRDDMNIERLEKLFLSLA